MSALAPPAGAAERDAFEAFHSAAIALRPLWPCAIRVMGFAIALALLSADMNGVRELALTQPSCRFPLIEQHNRLP
ncbi:MAG: hypothetical protein AAF296_02990 [Pseudomonadota bacterium]